MGTITNEEKIARFGYDPHERLIYIGSGKALYRGREEIFDFFYNAESQNIDVCYIGCNWTHCSGTEISDTETTLPQELTKAFFDVKTRISGGYSFRNKSWIGRIVVTPKVRPQGYKDGPLHFDVRYDTASGSIDIHGVGVDYPMFRGLVQPDSSTTLPEEFREMCKGLILHPQKSMDEHNTSCPECSVHITRRSRGE